MAGNTTGKIFRLTSFGESHGKAIGGVIDGCPAGLEIDFEAIAKDMARRKPGQSDLTTARTEEDQVDWLSGIFEGKTTGTPIAFTIPNKDQRSKDYSQVKDVFRPSHADYTYEAKYGLRDYRGGGRSSARETAVRVAAGAIAKQLLEKEGVSLRAFVTSVGSIDMELPIDQIDWQQAENELRCPDADATAEMRKAILQAKEAKDSLGGIITCVVKGVPPGLGEPVFDKIHAELGKAMLGINAVKGFEIGSGFAGTRMPGSAHNDAFTNDGGSVGTATNHSGGVQGGITNGMDIVCRIAFKPVASIGKNQQTVNKELEETELALEGRHDPCVVPRAVPIVEAMAALVLTDHLLRNRTARI